jgi:hypothetical protein
MSQITEAKATVAADVTNAESAVKIDVATAESGVKAFVAKYWPVAAAVVVGLIVGHLA